MRKPCLHPLMRGGKLQAWSEALQRLAMIVSDSDMHNAIGDPKVGPEQLYGLVAAAAGDALTPEVQNFVRVLIENDRLTLLPEIATLFEALKNEREGVIEAQIESAFPVDDASAGTTGRRSRAALQAQGSPAGHGRSGVDRRRVDYRRRRSDRRHRAGSACQHGIGTAR